MNKQLLTLFPTPIITVEIPKELSVACNYLDSIPQKDNGSSATYGTYSENTYVMNAPECKELGDFILKCVGDYGRNILGYDYDEYAFSQTWVSWKQPGQMHHNHTHPNSLISAVFFYGEREENTPAITFTKQFAVANCSYIQPLMVKDRKDIPTAWSSFSINYNPGLLIIFPSYLSHEVPINETKITRKSVSMNILPKGQIGDKNSLTQLIFGQVT
tara:strand:- start:125 stop:772 length:648 start_codon:yes stop_codon:yes gene_type:complete